jgi:hypothetical protein
MQKMGGTLMDWPHLSNTQAGNRAFSLTPCFCNKVGGTVLASVFLEQGGWHRIWGMCDRYRSGHGLLARDRGKL